MNTLVEFLVNSINALLELLRDPAWGGVGVLVALAVVFKERLRKLLTLLVEGLRQAFTISAVGDSIGDGSTALIHVTPHGDKWAVRREGREKVSSLHRTQKEAEQKGRQTARKHKSEFFLHNRQGEIRQRDSYGHDPFPPRG
jgi:hypothetical protein